MWYFVIALVGFVAGAWVGMTYFSAHLLLRMARKRPEKAKELIELLEGEM